MRMNNALSGLFKLDHNVRVYVPSTVNVDQTTDNAAIVSKTLTTFSRCFGGATAYDAMGAWESKDRGLVVEPVKIVESYATKEQITAHLQTVIDLAKSIKADMHQEAVSLEYDGELYFI